MNNNAKLYFAEISCLLGGIVKRLLIVVLLLLLPATCWSLATTMEFGVRGGVDDASLKEHYSAVEVYCLRNLPWQKEIAPGVRVYTRLDLGAAYLDGDAKDGGWISAGGDIVFSLLDGAFELEAGWRPAWLLEHEYGHDNFGGGFQFISHAGATVNMGRTTVNYRFQHISNAGLYDENPGLQMHMLGLGVRF